ncbi:MAG: class I SAM-dependent methyltransferase [Lachnospiraceae bacterium]|nr:class I SAM-dependent methyltransferase [Lachnospiraceae bacterium]
MQTQTITYYNQNATSFTQDTISVDFSETQNHFMSNLPAGARILDFGCGAGRDTKCFLQHGFHVDAIDGSEKLCTFASEYTGIHVQKMLFQDLDVKNVYDAIWACASILHLPKSELGPVLKKIQLALKENGILYTSFKYGEFEGERNGRYFTDFTIESFEKFMEDFSGIEIEEYWITKDVRPNRGEERWLNLILRKK